MMLKVRSDEGALQLESSMIIDDDDCMTLKAFDTMGEQTTILDFV